MTSTDMTALGWTVNQIGIWGPCGTGNFGNEMTMAAIVQNVRRLHPEAVLHLFSANPADTSERYEVPAMPMMRAAGHRGSGRFRELGRIMGRVGAPFAEVAFLRCARESVKDLDLLVFAGTGILTDSWGGAWRFPYNVFAWTWLARLGGTRVAVVSTGAGPIDSAASRRLIRSALGQVAYRSFRDQESKNLVESLGVRGDNRVCPDLAFSLAAADFRRATPSERSREVVIVGLPFRKPGGWENPNQEVYDRYLGSMAAFSDWLLREGYTVRLVPTHVRMDLSFIKDLESRLGSRRCGTGQLVTVPARTFEEIAAELSTAHIVVSSRFHGVVFSYLLGTPVLGISYHPKMNALMKDFGQEEFCVDLPTMDVSDVCARFMRLEAARLSVSSSVQRMVDDYRRTLAAQYETLLRL